MTRRALIWMIMAALAGCGTDPAQPPTPENTPALCSDGLDNDGDGQTDCDDTECAPLKICPTVKKDGGGPDGRAKDGAPPDAQRKDAAAPDGAAVDAQAPDALVCPKDTACVSYQRGDGGCVAKPAKQGTVCDDGNLCTQNDQCDGKGSCAGASYTCTAGPCETASLCDGKGGCTASYKASGALCDDKKPCTKSDQCDGKGTCAGTAYSCPAPGTCQDKVSCDGKGGCSITYTAQGKACDDNKLCTSGDQCDGKGACAGAPYSCADKLSCTQDICDGQGGCKNPVKPTECLIAQTCYAPGAKNPQNHCQTCQPKSSTTAWTTLVHCCGDGKVSGGEQCDGTALGGKTCLSQSFDGGVLGCTASCTFDTAACFSCAANTADCNALPGDRCETSLLTDPKHCSKCKNACPAPANAKATCSGGVCGFSCNPGYAACAASCTKDLASEASCDGKDEDCDGFNDEGCGSGSCSAPYLVNPAGGAYVHKMNGTGSHRGSCNVTTGMERVYRWMPKKSGSATIQIKTDYWPSTLYVRKGSCTGSEVACKGTSAQWPNYTLTLTVSAGTTYYIFADCHYNGSWTLTHTITFTPPS